MIEADIKAHLLPGLLAGTRNGLALDKVGLEDALQALSLTGQALAFERPVVPAAFQVEDVAADTRTLVPEALRRPLLRLLTGKSQGLVPAAFPDAIALTFRQRHLKLNPFDLVKLDDFVRGHTDDLGAEAAAFAHREAAPAERRGYFDAEALNDATWSLATPAVMAGYIAGRRRQDAEAARALVEAVWAGESADVRVRLLGALREGLSGGDAGFLTGLAKDRAPRVRELAARLLARLPGQAGDHPGLKAAVERIKVSQTGLFKKRTVLALELPATVQGHMAAAWVHEKFSDIGLEELAEALKLPVMDVVAAAEKDRNLLLALVLMATGDKRFDVLERLTSQYVPDVLEELLRAQFAGPGFMTADERARWAALIVQPAGWVKEMPVYALMRLPQWLDGPLPEAVMAEVLAARAWQAMLREPSRLQADVVDILAVLCPAVLRPRLRQQLAGLEPATVARAVLFFEIMDALEAIDV